MSESTTVFAPSLTKPMAIPATGALIGTPPSISARQQEQTVPMEGLPAAVGDAVLAIQASLLEAATTFRDANIHTPADYDELRQVAEIGWARAFWCGQDACEERIKDDTKATNRCIPLDQENSGPGRCIVCGQPAQAWSYWAKAY